MRTNLVALLSVCVGLTFTAETLHAEKKAQAPAPAATKKCANENALGVSRTVQIDTTGGPGFGFEHYKVHDFLADKEVILTFDDGPQVRTTKAVLDALDAHCTKATFFSIGVMALGLPQIIRDVAKRGHTVGTHTWSHKNLRKKKKGEAAVEEIEKGISAVSRALGKPTASFFRYPFLQDSKDTLGHLSKRNLGVFSTDIDSRDYLLQKPARLVKSIMAKLNERGKGILLMHDIKKGTAKAMPQLLDALKAGGYKIVHMTAKATAKPLLKYTKMIEKHVKGIPTAGNERPTSSIVTTVPTAP
ncbi:MAG: polysaccharide deacetylase family protein [Alphaproteobacteria bacterium]|nr:polysaccharide deacetylase family protein [Alphaproteobacteria bacterium]